MKELKQKILELVKDDLDDIEKALEISLNPYLDLVSEVARHILFSGGKRIRPLLMVLSCRLCGYSGDYDKTFSTTFELLHAATLLHDDLVDSATKRRGRPVAHSIYGNSTVVLVGDFLLARALSITAALENPRINKIVAEITENMSQGEIHQLSKLEDLNLSEEEYMVIIRNKTALLFKGACMLSAILANASEKEEAALADYGLSLGMAFQMADDLLDYTLDSKVLGKTVGADLREGKLTLPVIYALKAATPKDREIMEQIITNKNFSVHEFETLIELLKKYNGIEYTRNLASGFVENAKQALQIFKPTPTREVLLKIADYALTRKA